MDDSLLEFKKTFIEESYDLLDQMENNLLNYQAGTVDLDSLNAIFRCAHSIKGGAGMFGFEEIAKFTHLVETLLDLARESKIEVTDEVVEILLRAQDIKKQMIGKLEKDQIIEKDFGDEVRVKLETILGNETGNVIEITKEEVKIPVISEVALNYKIHFSPGLSSFINANDPSLIINALKKLGSLESELDFANLPSFDALDPKNCYLSWVFKLNTKHEERIIREVFEFVETDTKLEITLVNEPVQEIVEVHHEDKTAHEASGMEVGKKANSPSIRVDVDKVDKLINMVGELIITQSMLYDQVKNLPVDEFQGLIRGLDDLFHHSRELQEGVMAVRMQAVKSIFSRLPRLVRDLSTQLGKKIKLVTYGEMTEVDKTVIEQLSDPLTHMIRNSVDHGIEMPETRLANGKEEEGIITLEASHRGGKILIEISDNGGGINRARVLAKAKSKQLLPADAVLTNEEIDQLIFLAGLSTAEKVTNVSGRGVGMDVVKRNIQNLGGTIEIDNVEGQGTKFTLSLPLTLAILDGMVIKSGNESYIIPITNILETLRPKKDEIKTISANKEVINMRGEFIPIFHLKDIFNSKSKINNIEDSLILVLEDSKNKFGLIVDELVGQQQVVIKNIEDALIPTEGISGATILGDGKVSFILDITKLESLHNKISLNKTKLNLVTGDL